MKTQSKIKGLLAIIFTVFMFFNGKSQCPYTITNNLSCDVTVDIVIFSGTPAQCNYCSTTSGLNIGANSQVPIDCTGCPAVCDIQVTVTYIGVTSISSSAADFTGAAVTAGFGNCGSNSIQYNGTSDFKIQ